jgi:hypothetical protein
LAVLVVAAAAAAVVVVVIVAAAAEGWTSESSCSPPGLIEENVEVDEVRMVIHTALAAEESAYEVQKVDHTGSKAEAGAEAHTEVVAVGLREDIDCSRN